MTGPDLGLQGVWSPELHPVRSTREDYLPELCRVHSDTAGGGEGGGAAAAGWGANCTEGQD